MSHFKSVLVVAVIGLVSVIGFQNCSPPSASPTAVSASGAVTVDMSASSAQAMAVGYLSQCSAQQAASASFPLVSPNGNITVSLTSATARASAVGLVQGSGNLIVYGTTSGAKINSMTAYTGNLTLCGISLGTISGSSIGNISVESGTVDSISGFSGNLIILGGTTYPASITHFTGNIVIKTAAGAYIGRSYQVP